MDDGQEWRDGQEAGALKLYDAVLGQIRREVGDRFTVVHVMAALHLRGIGLVGDNTVSMLGRPNSQIAWDASAPLAFILLGLGMDRMIGGGPCKPTRYPLKSWHPKLPYGRRGAKDFAEPRWVPMEYVFLKTARTR